MLIKIDPNHLEIIAGLIYDSSPSVNGVPVWDIADGWIDLLDEKYPRRACLNCGETYRGRDNKTYCSATCRKAASRDRLSLQPGRDKHGRKT